MNFTKRLFYSSTVILLCLLLSCGKYIKDDYPDGCICERFEGLFNMYEPHEDINYDMIIDCHCDPKAIEDTLFLFNFAGQFDISFPVSKSGLYVTQEDTTEYNWTDGGFFFGIEDKNGHKTALSAGGPWYGFDTNVNRLIGDSIFLRYESNNVAFYINDSVPYEAFSVITKGKKIH